MTPKRRRQPPEHRRADKFIEKLLDIIEGHFADMSKEDAVELAQTNAFRLIVLRREMDSAKESIKLLTQQRDEARARAERGKRG